MKRSTHEYDTVVCGGGMAGFCAAMAAARAGSRTCLIQDRPVLGGNASSEVRVTVHGAACHHTHCRETGLVGEALRAERRTNHLFPIENGWTNSVHDMALYNLAVSEPNLTLHLNTSLRDVQMEDGRWGLDCLGEWPAATDEKGYLHRPACHEGTRIAAIRATVANAETELLIHGKTFIDCTGDALLAHLSGCEWRMGSESREETGEVHAPEKASRDTMGNSIHIRCIDTGRPAPFSPPEWAVSYDDAAFFYEQGRRPNEPEGGFWWIEIGVPWDTIHDNETIRHELTRHALGVWDWMKNKDPKMMDRCRNYALEFIGQVPGKRESRRVMGHHFLDENELQRRERFDDTCAFGGWFIDLHTPGGLLAPTSEPDSALGYNPDLASVALKFIGPYGIPLRSLVSRDVENLAMAGRNISVTHAALGTVRVMATCGLMGEAAGTLAATAVRNGAALSRTLNRATHEIQQVLLRNGCYLPGFANADPADQASRAKVRASSEYAFPGLGTWDRVEDTGLREKAWTCGTGRTVALSKRPCQWFQIDGGPLDRLGPHLVNQSGQTQSARVTLRKVDSIWDYDEKGGTVLWSDVLEVPPEADDIIWAETALAHAPAGTCRLELEGSAEVAWRCSSNRALGLAGGSIIGSGRYHWNRLHGEMALRMEPAQKVYSAGMVISGVTRPVDITNTWFSDPSKALPQWIELTWPETVSLRTIELTFPTQLILETHWENPFYVAPQVARRYTLSVPTPSGRQILLRESDNADIKCVHNLDTPLRTDSLRLTVEETHGGRYAGLVEIRCY